MSYGIVRRPAFIALVVAFTVAVAGVALANEYEPNRPPTGQPGFIGPIVLVCRATDVTTPRPGRPGQCTTGIDNLMNGETVQVTVATFNINSDGTLRQCTVDLTLCEAQGVPFTTGKTGVSNPKGQPTAPSDPLITPTPFTVKAFFQAAGDGTVNCFVTACAIYAYSNSFNEQLAACHGLTFAGGPPSVCTQLFSPTTTSTSTSTSTSVPATTSTSTSTTSTSTTSTSTTSTSTTSTSVPATTSTSTSSTSTSLPSTSLPSTSTTLSALDRCAALVAARSSFNAQIDQLKSSVGPSLSAQLEAVRAQGNGQLDAALRSCTGSTA